ncbi:TlpA family protein disulfide reductase [Flammeovirga pacifica]|uniref:Alkyl hydroperoxide reductase subunit C/ Thiol specific antioxidant domain-containing protein n=1 Tax=Flammeovirga pacifica TaxID=915059 RepID=A0A1S1YWS5_FLAPC|nr:redoxin domain-containing protein [Flammeovirga pacifica]OHX65454.1 hypothetical protein NH26_03370 [Flammeovirga pacifica]
MHFFQNFELRDYNQKVFKFSQLEKQTFLLVFINDVDTLRDQQHLQALKEIYSSLIEQEVQLLLISSLSELKISDKLKKKRFPYPILSDPKRRLSKYLKIEIPQLSLVQRSTVVYQKSFQEIDRFTFMSSPEKHIEFIENLLK